MGVLIEEDWCNRVRGSRLAPESKYLLCADDQDWVERRLTASDFHCGGMPDHVAATPTILPHFGVAVGILSPLEQPVPMDFPRQWSAEAAVRWLTISYLGRLISSA